MAGTLRLNPGGVPTASQPRKVDFQGGSGPSLGTVRAGVCSFQDLRALGFSFQCEVCATGGRPEDARSWMAYMAEKKAGSPSNSGIEVT